MVALVQHRSPPSAANALVANAANSTDSGRRRRFRRPLNPVDAFDSAAADLYVGEPAAQVSAVHALADVADGSPFTRRQQCVDVLCGYLRQQWPTGRDMGDERTVRDTIVAVLADRMRRRRSAVHNQRANACSGEAKRAESDHRAISRGKVCWRRYILSRLTACEPQLSANSKAVTVAPLATTFCHWRGSIHEELPAQSPHG